MNDEYVIYKFNRMISREAGMNIVLFDSIIQSINRVRESMKSGDIKAVTQTLRAEIGRQKEKDSEDFKEMFERKLAK